MINHPVSAIRHTKQLDGTSTKDHNNGAVRMEGHAHGHSGSRTVGEVIDQEAGRGTADEQAVAALLQMNGNSCTSTQI